MIAQASMMTLLKKWVKKTSKNYKERELQIPWLLLRNNTIEFYQNHSWMI